MVFFFFRKVLQCFTWRMLCHIIKNYFYMHEIGQRSIQTELWIFLDIRDSISDPGSVLNGRFDCQGEATRAHSRSLKPQQTFYLYGSSGMNERLQKRSCMQEVKKNYPNIKRFWPKPRKIFHNNKNTPNQKQNPSKCFIRIWRSHVWSFLKELLCFQIPLLCANIKCFCK